MTNLTTHRGMRYQYMPPLSDAELEALTESISTFGVLQAVVTDEDGNILDGHHRAEIATALGLEYPTVTLPGLTDEQKIEQSLLLNLGRRHLDITERRELVQKLRDEGLSVRWISDKTGIPKSTVQRDTQRVPGGTPEYVTGKDGKTYQAKNPVPRDDGTEHWRRTVAAATGGGTICATTDEYYDFLSGLPDLRDLDREEVAEDWERKYLAELGSQWSFKADGDMDRLTVLLPAADRKKRKQTTNEPHTPQGKGARVRLRGTHPHLPGSHPLLFFSQSLRVCGGREGGG